jgi:hypothetical protein
MSRVFLAEETRLGRRVVIKVLSPDLGASLSAEQFEREIRLAARLQHPHIAADRRGRRGWVAVLHDAVRHRRVAARADARRAHPSARRAGRVARRGEGARSRHAWARRHEVRIHEPAERNGVGGVHRAEEASLREHGMALRRIVVARHTHPDAQDPAW